MAAALGVPLRANGDYINAVQLTGDNNYPTGGYVLTPAQLGFSLRTDFVIPIANSTSRIAEWVAATGAIRILNVAGGVIAEVNNGTDLSALTVNLLAFGV